MTHPGAERVFVDPPKVRDYLLSPIHPEGRDKAFAFAAAGYSQRDWQLLVSQLRLLGTNGIAHDAGINGFGRKFTVDGILHTPTERDFSIRTIWIVHFGDNVAQFVTAYPWRHR